MPSRIVACVPNFSEGRDASVIRQITGEIEATPGAKLLDVDSDPDTNRTVVTFAAPPEAASEAAFRAICKATELIDMRQHHGAHPRMGTTDVCPFIPVSGVSIDECVALARDLARRVGEELRIPVYLYAYAAARPDRRSLPHIREGEYEALPNKLCDPDFRPDFGPAEFNARSGATVIGVRDFLLAFNVNLDTADPAPAREIARVVREKGTAGAPGRLKACQAGGWYIDRFRCAQVTMNLLNYKITGLHTAIEAVREEAAKRGLRVTGSELVGVVPKQALFDAGRFYIRKSGGPAIVSEQELIQAAVRALGLDDKAPFNPDEKVIEYALARG